MATEIEIIFFVWFLQEADADLEETQDVIERIRKQSSRLAQHFCENEKTFNLDEFLATFRHFCEKIKACQQVSLLKNDPCFYFFLWAD